MGVKQGPAAEQPRRQLYREIAERLRYYRKRLGLTQQECANALGIARSAYASYELDTIDGREARVGDLMRLAKLFNVSLLELTGELEVERDPLIERAVAKMQHLSPAQKANVVAFIEMSNTVLKSSTEGEVAHRAPSAGRPKAPNTLDSRVEPEAGDRSPRVHSA